MIDVEEVCMIEEVVETCGVVVCKLVVAWLLDELETGVVVVLLTTVIV